MEGQHVKKSFTSLAYAAKKEGTTVPTQEKRRKKTKPSTNVEKDAASEVQNLEKKMERVKIAAAKTPVTKPFPSTDPFSTELEQLKRRFESLPAYSFELNKDEALLKVS